MIRAVYFNEHVFRVSVKLIKGGIHHRVVGEAFELIDLRLETIAPGLRTIHGIDFSHNVVSIPVDLGIPFSALLAFDWLQEGVKRIAYEARKNAIRFLFSASLNCVPPTVKNYLHGPETPLRPKSMEDCW